MQNCTFSVRYFFNICLIFFWLKKKSAKLFSLSKSKVQKSKCVFILILSNSRN